MSLSPLAMLLGTTLALGATLDVPTSPVRTPRRRNEEHRPLDLAGPCEREPRPEPYWNDHGATPAERAITRGPTHNPGRLTRRERRRRAGR